LTLFTETIKAKDIKFGTMVYFDMTIYNTYRTVTLTFGQGQRSKQEHCHIYWKLLKIQSPNLAQGCFVTCFTIYITLWPWPKVKVTWSRSKQQHCHISRKLLKIQSPNLAQWYFMARCFRAYVEVLPSSIRVRKKTHTHIAVFLKKHLLLLRLQWLSVVVCGKEYIFRTFIVVTITPRRSHGKG